MEIKKEEEPAGTVILVYLFLAVFALYYFFNWKFLGALWTVG